MAHSRLNRGQVEGVEEVIDITLAKLKYRNPNSRWVFRTHIEGRYGIPAPGTRVYSAGSFGAKPRTNQPKAAVKTLRPRKKAYGPF
jgi:hypothetical protein